MVVASSAAEDAYLEQVRLESQLRELSKLVKLLKSLEDDAGSEDDELKAHLQARKAALMRQ